MTVEMGSEGINKVLCMLSFSCHVIWQMPTVAQCNAISIGMFVMHVSAVCCWFVAEQASSTTNPITNTNVNRMTDLPMLSCRIDDCIHVNVSIHPEGSKPHVSVGIRCPSGGCECHSEAHSCSILNHDVD